MSARPTHYEVFSRKVPASGWVLQLALEDRDGAIAAAREMMTSSKACAVKVTKEVLDQDTGEYRSSIVINEGAPELKARPKRETASEAVCGSPQELYTQHAREKIARLFEDWLKRHQVTAYELLHRPDLAEILEASGTELQHAIQKLSIPEAQDTGASLHELIRRWTVLADKTTTRLITDGRKNLFPDLNPEAFLAQLDKMSGHAEKAYVLGGAIARALKTERGALGKLKTLLPYVEKLAEDLAKNGAGREWAIKAFEAPILEIFSNRATMTEVMGADQDLGNALCILTRLAAGPAADMVIKLDPKVGAIIPPLTGIVGGYQRLVFKGHMQSLVSCASKRLMVELKGPRRLKANDPTAEIDLLRALALVMSAAGKEQTQRDDVMEAFAERSKMLVSADFVDDLIQSAKNEADAIEKLIWLCENVVGSANKRQAGRWLISQLSAPRFDRDMRDTGRPASQRLSYLAELQRRLEGAKLPDKEAQDVRDKVGQVGAQVAQDAQLLANIMRSPAPALQKLSVLLGLASGRSAPVGPLTEQARSEALKILRVPEVRQSMATQPQVLAQLMPMIKAAGLAG
jgi:hypothetical protein